MSIATCEFQTAGSASTKGMFATTLTFLFSTPGVVEPSLDFPALSALPGQFLIKDVILLGAALWSMGEALTAVQRENSDFLGPACDE